MMRSGVGNGRNPVLAPHQSSRRSQITSLGDVLTTFHAAVVSGQPFSRSKYVNPALSSTPRQMCSGTQNNPYAK